MKILQSKTEEKIKHGDLEQQYKELEQFWDSCKQSKPRTTKRRCLSDKTNLYQLSISPRNLMSSLQKTETPSEEETECIRNHTRAAIESGKFRGRRLFEKDDEMGCGELEEICSNLSNNDGEIDNCGDKSSLSSSSALSSEKLEDVVVMEENRDFEGEKRNGFLGWFLLVIVVLIVFFVGMLFFKSFGSKDHHEVILVPT